MAIGEVKKGFVQDGAHCRLSTVAPVELQKSVYPELFGSIGPSYPLYCRSLPMADRGEILRLAGGNGVICIQHQSYASGAVTMHVATSIFGAWTATIIDASQVSALFFAGGYFYAVSGLDILRSANGSTWDVFATTEAQVVNILAGGGAILAADSGGVIYAVSADSVTAVLTSGMSFIDLLNDGTKWSVLFSDGVNGYYIYSSSDGLTWSAATLLPVPQGDIAGRIMTGGGRLVLSAGYQYLFESVDHGATWELLIDLGSHNAYDSGLCLLTDGGDIVIPGNDYLQILRRGSVLPENVLYRRGTVSMGGRALSGKIGDMVVICFPYHLGTSADGLSWQFTFLPAAPLPVFCNIDNIISLGAFYAPMPTSESFFLPAPGLISNPDIPQFFDPLLLADSMQVKEIASVVLPVMQGRIYTTSAALPEEIEITAGDILELPFDFEADYSGWEAWFGAKAHKADAQFTIGPVLCSWSDASAGQGSIPFDGTEPQGVHYAAVVLKKNGKQMTAWSFKLKIPEGVFSA